MHQITVKQATPEHAESVCEVLTRSIREICAKDYNYDESILKEWLRNKTPDNVKTWIESRANYSLAAFDTENQIVGFILMSDDGEILLNYVIPEFKSRGVGKQLLHAMEKIAIEHGLKNIKTISTVSAKSFYERNGFLKNGDTMYVGDILGDFPLIKILSR